MNAIGFVVQALCDTNFSTSQFSLAAETPGGILGFLGLAGAALAHYVQAKRKAAPQQQPQVHSLASGTRQVGK